MEFCYEKISIEMCIFLREFWPNIGLTSLGSVFKLTILGSGIGSGTETRYRETGNPDNADFRGFFFGKDLTLFLTKTISKKEKKLWVAEISYFTQKWTFVEKNFRFEKYYKKTCPLNGIFITKF